ncbi:MAG: dTDP-4-dehydrorhamnose 3,5-epimerase [Flavobacteriales bacterium]|nr:dTDP-4-dehydrorhamnose 3,5-epimerase [Flavobacteriales bacterium]
MEFTRCTIDGLVIIDPKVFGDARGYFFESYNRSHFEQAGLDMTFVQDNQSFSGKGILRGLHFQSPPNAQGKLLRVVQGSIYDVAVDIRKDSATYGKYEAVVLSGDNKRMFYIPPGFAHGFYTLEPDTLVQYKCTDVYAPQSEGGLMWNDPDLGIGWPLDGEPLLSEKDGLYKPFREFQSPF